MSLSETLKTQAAVRSTQVRAAAFFADGERPRWVDPAFLGLLHQGRRVKRPMLQRPTDLFHVHYRRDGVPEGTERSAARADVEYPALGAVIRAWGVA